MTNRTQPGLGRWAAPDERDEKYLLRELSGTPTLESLPEYRYHYSPWCLDQGPYPRCVGYSTKTMLLNGPVQQKNPNPTPEDLYFWAQRNDEWEGENYDGTSVRAGMKAAAHFGKVTEYRWAFSLEDAVRWLLMNGPLVVGFDWFSDMSNPDSAHFMHPTGNLQGGHAFGLIGASRTARKVRVLNNWGRGWADGGRAWMSFDSLEYLLAQDGEAACPTEKAV